MRMRTGRAAAAAIVVAALAASSATAGGRKHVTHHAQRTTRFLVGVNDEALTLYGNPAKAFAQLRALRVQVLRVNLYWGGTKWAVANTKPTDARDPGDPAYDWSLYDRLVRYAANSGIKVVFSILFTPSWANGGAGKNHAPTSFTALQDFAYAAATRYSGTYVPPASQQQPSLAGPDEPLPSVKLWTAWNEPNNPVFLTPQYRRVGGSWRVQSAYDYARICNAVYSGIHSGGTSGEQVACGVTDPKGNDVPTGVRSSVDPLTFLAAAHRYGMKTFDVYAHHPYAAAGNESPAYVPRGRFRRRVQLGNINLLLSEISRFYGPKHLWITEYGYQTNPPNGSIMATSWAKQALYLRQAYTQARANPRIDMMLWFPVQDQPSTVGWQSGLETITGRKKPAWNAYRGVPRS